MSFFQIKVFTNVSSGASVTSIDYYPANKNRGDGAKIGYLQVVADDNPTAALKDTDVKVEGKLDSDGTVYSRLHLDNLTETGVGGVHGGSNYYSQNSKFIRLVQFVLVPVIRVRVTAVTSQTNTLNVWLMF